MSDLQTFRDQIDTIDNQIIDLLKERTRIVKQVGTLKKSEGERGLFIRPGREGAMHRRIYKAFQGSGLSPLAMVSIWRLLIAASTHLESPLSMAVPAQGPYKTLAREYFSSAIPCLEVSSPAAALAAVADQKQVIAILPWPDDNALWWTQFASYARNGLHIFAGLPAVMQGATHPLALAIGKVQPEASGEDHSYIHVGWNDPALSSSRVSDHLPGEIIRNHLEGDTRHLLVRLNRFAAADDSDIAALQMALPAVQIDYLGAHPVPVEA